MKHFTTILLTLAVALNFVLGGWILLTRGERQKASADTTWQTELLSVMDSVRELRQELRSLEPPSTRSPARVPAADGEESTVDSGLTARLQAIEHSLARLQGAMDGISIDGSSEERAEQFASENGHLKADEYFEAGKFAIAGEGYLRFLEHHPDHPDHKNILERARDSFTRAGYTDKALWAQEEYMRIYPENAGENLMTLAHLEKKAKRFKEAASHAAESAQHIETSGRYWNLMYAAWYTQLADGNAAGLSYYRDVERQIQEAGYGDDKVGERVREKIAEIERQMSAGN